MKKKGVISLWKAIMLVFVGLFAVTGATVLVLALMGRFNEEKIEPKDIVLVQQVDTGEGTFNVSTGQFEVASDFWMTITSSTTDVTEKKVTLSFVGGTQTPVRDGLISNEIIKIPQEVYINTPFKVTLETDWQDKIGEDWINGGTSIIQAKSSNVLCDTITFKVAVDVPVPDTGLESYIFETSKDATVQEVIVGSTFSVTTNFTPSTSRYMFSDTNKEKKIFYSFSKSHIDFDWDTGMFEATSRSTSAVDVDTISVYTFKNSYLQDKVLKEFSSIKSEELLTASVLEYFNENPNDCVLDVVKVHVNAVNVGEVKFDAAGTTFNANVDQYFTLTVDSKSQDGSLGVEVTDSQGYQLNGVLGSVGIKYNKEISLDQLSIKGGKVIKVEKKSDGDDVTYMISAPESFASVDFDNIPNDVEYYILPDTTPSVEENYYWRFDAREAVNSEFKLNFFYEQEAGQWKSVFDFDESSLNAERSFTLDCKVHDYEEPPAWKSVESLKIEINYDASGTPISSPIDLAAELNPINAENIYRNVRYFILVDTAEPGYANLTNTQMQEIFGCKAPVGYDGSIDMVTAAAPYALFEIEDTTLSVSKSFAGKIKVVAATIRTYADQITPYLNAGKYQIINFSRAREVEVESTLAVSNMTPTYSFDTNAEITKLDDGYYYVPAINRNDDGTSRNVINFKLTLSASEDVAGDANKIEAAYNNGDLEVVCVDENGNETETSYVKLANFIENGSGKTEVVFVGTLNIEETKFSANENGYDQGHFVGLALKYDDGKKEYMLPVALEGEGETEGFYIYFQQPKTIKAAYEDDPTIDPTQRLVVDISQKGVNITWGATTITGTTLNEAIEKLNVLLTFTLYDQFGREIEKNAGIYSYRFTETPADVSKGKIIGFDSTQSMLETFLSTQGDTLTTTITMQVYDIKADKEVVLKNGDGTPQEARSFTFDIKSEGVEKVMYDVLKDYTPSANGGVDYEHKLEEKTTDKTNITVEKYITRNSKITLRDIIAVYISSDLANPVANLKITLDENYLATLTTQSKKDFMKVLAIETEDAMAAAESLEAYSGKNIMSITASSPFKDDTRMMFDVCDANNSLFNVSLELVLKSDITASPSFNKIYEDETNQKYLIKKGNAESVFADSEFVLDDYITLNSISNPDFDYSWSVFYNGYTIDQFASSPDGRFYEESGNAIIIWNGDSSVLKLAIKQIYQFKSVTFTIYFGEKSTFTFSQTITLYVNPNVVVRQYYNADTDSRFIDLQNLGSATLANRYEIYKLTDYINNSQGKESFTDLDPLTKTAGVTFTFSNEETDKYINISQNAGTGIENYTFTVVANSTLNLNLGETKGQTFKIRYDEGDGENDLNAVKVIEKADGKNEIITQAQEDLPYIELLIGLGGTDAIEMANSILQRYNEGELLNVKVVTYNEIVHLLLINNARYVAKDGFEIVSGSATNNLTTNANELRTKNLDDFLSLEGNVFEVTKAVKVGEDTMTVKMKLNAIVSRIGEQFVGYYEEGGTEEKYTNTDLKTIMGTYKALEWNDIYQTLQAGKSYRILHDVTESETGYGFYYDGEMTGAGTNASPKTSEYQITIVTDAEGYIDGLATLDGTTLKINHIEQENSNAYIVLKIRMNTYTGGHVLEWYYRIKVTPSFVKGTAYYPYADNAEHLDTLSSYYADGKYEISLDEVFEESNSNGENLGKTRFSGISAWLGEFIDDEPEVTYQYAIKKIMVDEAEIVSSSYVTFFDETPYFDGEKLIISPKDSEQKITVIVVKTFHEKLANGAAGDKLIGSEIEYTFKINQSSNYVETVTRDTNLLEEVSENVYHDTITAGSRNVQYQTSIKISNGTTESVVSEYSIYIKSTSGSDLSDAFQEFVGYGYFVFGGGNLTLAVKSTVIKDHSFEIGFYTSEKVVFKLNINVVSYFTWTQNTQEFTGGKVYDFIGQNGLFAEMKSTKGDITDFIITHNDSEDEGFATINSNSIEFAHLTQDRVFEFVGTIIDANGSYQFNFEVTVKANFNNTDKVRIYDDTTAKYGKVGFKIERDTIIATFADLELPSTNGEYKFERTSSGVMVSDDSFLLTPVSVGVKTNNVIETITVGYYYENEFLFNFEVRYRYSIEPSVSVEPNYPAPDDVTELETEHIGTTSGVDGYMSEKIENFFNSANSFAKDNANRIVVTKNANITEPLTNDVEITVATISNAKIYVTGGNASEISTGATLLYQGTVDEEQMPDIDLRFELLNTASNGQVLFSILVNQVNITYSVTIISGSVVQISTFTPNYTTGDSGSYEVIYAEDLATYTDKALFKQDRILSYNFSPAAERDKTYYLRFATENNENEVIAIKASSLNNAVNVDLQKSYIGFSYIGTFTSQTAAENDTAAEKISDSTLYNSAPSLHGRIVAVYCDTNRTQIKLNNDVELYVKRNGGTKEKADDFKLAATNYNQGTTPVVLDIILKIDGNEISTNATYGIMVDLEFTVEGNADSADSYTTATIMAGEKKSLLSISSFKIINKRTGQYYTTDSMKDSGASLLLTTYGFSDFKLEGNSNAGLGIDAKLKTYDEATGIAYHTGLSPRAGAKVDEATSGDLTKNYIAQAGQASDGKIYDYEIRAIGSNNDGNHVLMRLTYTVDIDGVKISKYHDVLFKVVPNSTVTFKSKYENALVMNPSGTEKDSNNQTVASNKETPYEISDGGENATVNFLPTSESGEKAPVVNAQMYGSGTNNADTFSYSYTNTATADGEYNVNADLFIQDVSGTLKIQGEGWKDPTAEKVHKNKSTGNLIIKITKELTLGNRNYVVEMENDFGYKVKFYFTVIAKMNPEIDSMSTRVIKEGQTIAVGAKVNELTPNSLDGTSVLYNAFEYDGENDAADGCDPNKIEIDYEEKEKSHGKAGEDYKVTKVRLLATLQGTGQQDIIIRKDIQNIVSGEQHHISGPITIVDEDDKTLTDNKANEYDWMLVSDSSTVKVQRGVYDETNEIYGLNEAKVVVSLTIERIDNSAELGQFTVYKHIVSGPAGNKTGIKYALETTYTASSIGVEPMFTDGADFPDVQVVVDGFDTSAIANSYGAVDQNAINEHKSTLDTIKVSEINFYLGNTKINTSALIPNGSDVGLITRNDYTFNYESGSFVVGERYNKDKHKFTMPTINGFYFGTSNQIDNVRMIITLTDGDDSFDLVETVSVRRNLETENLFESKLTEGNRPAYDNDPSKVNAVYNDTLEVVLDPGEKIEFVVDDEKFEGTNTTEGKKVISLTNDKTYTVTEYVGIHASISGLTDNIAGNMFYLKVTDFEGDPEICYNGSSLINSLTKTTDGTVIAGYADGLTLRIEESEELNAGGNYKSEKLFFILKKTVETNDYYYQHEQTFNVYPIAKSMTIPVAASGLSVVKEYMAATNGNATQSYYIIPLAKWAGNATFINYIINTPIDYSSLMGSAKYKFYFEIPSGESGAGAAFIDENGCITTYKGFDVKTEYIDVNVYVKLSGHDGNFETEGKLLIGSFTLCLDPNGAVTTDSTSAGIYNIGGDIVVIDEGYTLCRGGNSYTAISSLSPETAALTIACNTNETIDLRKHLTLNKKNEQFHIVAMKKDGVTTYIPYDNLNTIKFTSIGMYELTVIMSSRSSYTNITGIKVFVYSTTTREEKQVALKTDNTFSLGEINDTDRYTWYELDADGKITNSDAERYTAPSKVGIYDVNYIVEDTMTKLTKKVKVSYYVYSEEQSVNVGLVAATTYALSNMDKTVLAGVNGKVSYYQVNEDNTITSAIPPKFIVDENTMHDVIYIAYITNDTGELIAVKKINTTFNIVSNTVTEKTSLIQGTYSGDVAGEYKWTVDCDATAPAMIQDDLKTKLGLAAVPITLQEIDSNNIISACSDAITTPSQNLQIVTKNYIATYDGKFYRYKFTFYVYTAEKIISVSASQSMAYKLSNLDTNVRNATGAAANAIVTYYELNDLTLTRVETISLQATTNKTYYVKVGESYYKINFTINV